MAQAASTVEPAAVFDRLAPTIAARSAAATLTVATRSALSAQWDSQQTAFTGARSIRGPVSALPTGAMAAWLHQLAATTGVIGYSSQLGVGMTIAVTSRDAVTALQGTIAAPGAPQRGDDFTFLYRKTGGAPGVIRWFRASFGRPSVRPSITSRGQSSGGPSIE